MELIPRVDLIPSFNTFLSKKKVQNVVIYSKIRSHLDSSASIELITVVESIPIVEPILIVEPVPLEEPNPIRHIIPPISFPIHLNFLGINGIPIPIPKNNGVITSLTCIIFCGIISMVRILISYEVMINCSQLSIQISLSLKLLSNTGLSRSGLRCGSFLLLGVQ